MKLVIFDLDETLWEGDIFNNNSIKPKDNVEEVLRQLQKADIKLAVCSHNKIENVTHKLMELRWFNYFDIVEASITEEKDIMVKRILKKLDCDPLETLFIDDSGINRALVHTKTGCHIDYFEDLTLVFKYISTNRLKIMYQENKRRVAENLFEGTLKDFIKDSDMKLNIRVAHENDIPRIVALTQRTNHLNATQERFNDKQVTEMVLSDNYMVYVVDAKDNYGDYGTIAEIIIYKDKGEYIILDLCVSCRVMNRGIGSELLRYFTRNRKMLDVGMMKMHDTTLIGRIKTTDKNKQMEKLFEKSDLKFFKEEKGIKIYRWPN